MVLACVVEGVRRQSHPPSPWSAPPLRLKQFAGRLSRPSRTRWNLLALTQLTTRRTSRWMTHSAGAR